MRKLLKFLAELFKPISKFISKISLPYNKKLVTGADYYRSRDRIKPGDIIITRLEGELTNAVIPGFWTHGAVYAGYLQIFEDSQETFPCVIEATTKGLVLTDLVSFLMSKDYFVTLKPTSGSFSGEKAVDFLLKKLGTPYDWDFDYTLCSNDEFYCFEASALAYNHAVSQDEDKLKGEGILGKETFIANTFLNSKLFKITGFSARSEPYLLGYGKVDQLKEVCSLGK